MKKMTENLFLAMVKRINNSTYWNKQEKMQILGHSCMLFFDIDEEDFEKIKEEE